jgi:hypothetical protein
MEASLVLGAFDTEKADFLCPHFCVKKTYSRQCMSMGWLLGQAWWMWWLDGWDGGPGASGDGKWERWAGGLGQNLFWYFDEFSNCFLFDLNYF